MWQELRLVHSKPQEGELGSHTWRTCLREIQFLPPGSHYGLPLAQGEFFSGAQAHRFLVEVCSGLHSPLLGETEVFGQFRAFRDSREWHRAWEPMLDAVEEDVKKLRRQHLKNLGAQSYGSLARKRVPEGEPVVVVGSGLLAKDLIPWLSRNPVTLLVRNKAKRQGWWEKGRVLSYEELDQLPDSAHWILAAPVSNETLSALWIGRRVGTLLDFRGEARFEASPASTYFDLSTLFGELEAVRSRLASHKTLAMEAAARYSQQREVGVYHRPYGWEDAFA